MWDIIFSIYILVALVYFVKFLMRKIEHFTSGDNVLDQLREELSVLHPRFKSVEMYRGDKSYTIDKEKVYICLKDENGNYYDRNMLIYVICHEYAHILNKTPGEHTPQFKKIFDELLDKAAKLGIYNPNIPPVKNYCGYKY